MTNNLILATTIVLFLALIASKYSLIQELLEYSAIHTINQSIWEDFNLKSSNIYSYQDPTFQHVKPTSIWCAVLKPDDPKGARYCRAESVCFRRKSNEFLFILDPKVSTIHPPVDKIGNDFGSLSTVVDHNRYQLKHMASVPFSRIKDMNSTLFWIPGTSIIFSRFKPDNLLHLIHDDLLPLMATIREQGLFHHDRNSLRIFFEDHWPESFGRFFYRKLSPSIFFRNTFPLNSVICFQNAYLGLSSSTVWYQYGFKKPQSSVEKSQEEYDYIRVQIDLLREQTYRLFSLENDCAIRHTLLITRQTNRKILNQIEFGDFLRTEFSHSPFRMISTENDYLENVEKFRNMLQHIQCAHTLISMHGSEQILSIFIRPPLPGNQPVRVIELFPFNVPSNHSTVYRTLVARILGYRYSAWTNPFKTNTRFPPDHSPEKFGGLSTVDEVDKQLVRKSVDQPLQRFLCCDHPVWLHHIYQDTIIDLQTFKTFLDHDQGHMNPPINGLSTFPIQLSEVENLQCNFIKNETISVMNITWDPPWNLPFWLNESVHFGQTSVFSFQIAIQNISDSNQPAVIYETSKPSMEMLLETSQDDYCYHVWAKIKIHDLNLARITSSFNRQPFFCCY